MRFDPPPRVRFQLERPPQRTEYLELALILHSASLLPILAIYLAGWILGL